jgi:ABC-2 type transport system permease protein
MSEPTVSSSRAVRLVARREIRVRATSRAFRIITLIMILAVVAFVLILKVTGGKSNSTIGFTAETAALSQPLVSLGQAVDQPITASTVDQATGEQQLRDGTLDALVVGSPTNFQVEVKKNLSPALTNVFTVLTRQIVLNEQIRQAGGNPASVDTALAQATVHVQALEPAPQFQTERIILGVIIGVLVYVGMMLYGQQVSQGVVEEKASRIVELLLATIRPWQLMLGKVIGIGVVGLSQLLLVSTVGLIAGLRTHVISFPANIAVGIAAWGVIWFLLGFLAYALLFASLGALVSRQEEIAGATAPALLLVIAPYVLGISILPSDPGNPFLTVLSMIPLFSPELMPMRIAIGSAPLWQAFTAAGLTIALIVGLVWLSGRIYTNAVLRTGARVSLREALRSAA